MKKLLLSLLFVGFLSAQAQNASDSATIVQADWHTEKIAKGIRLKSAWFHDLYGSPQNVNMVIVNPRLRLVNLLIAALPKEKLTTSVFAEENNAIAAINGTFFDVKNGGSVMLIKKDGEIINTTRLNKENERSERSNGAVCIDEKKVLIVKGNNTQANWDEQLTAENVMVSGPVLLIDGELVKLSDGLFNTARHPRSAIATLPDGKVMLLTVDGRNEKSAGMNLHELAFLMKVLNADDALNLDGGGSTTLWVKNQSDNGVVNRPSDNKKFDNYGQRKVANAILVVKKESWLQRLF